MYVREFSNNQGQVAHNSGERFGIELEVENASLPDNIHDQRHWRYVEDGSLRNSGLEFVSNPIGPEDLDDALSMFYGWMDRLGYESSIRTSTHVHVNVLDHTMEQLGAVLAAYCIVEPLLFRFVGPEREENIYCVPWYRSDDQAESASDGVNRRYIHFNQTCKYSSLYLEPIIRYGTIEFRHAPLFEAQRELDLWIRLIRRITYHVPTIWDDAEAVITAFDQGCDDFLDELFGAELVSDLSVYCQGDFEAIIDDADSLTVAEHLVPSLCTYKVTDSDWNIKGVQVEGDNVRGYRHVAFRRGSPMYAFEEPALPEDEYYDGDEYPEEEW